MTFVYPLLQGHSDDGKQIMTESRIGHWTSSRHEKAENYWVGVRQQSLTHSLTHYIADSGIKSLR